MATKNVFYDNNEKYLGFLYSNQPYSNLNLNQRLSDTIHIFKSYSTADFCKNKNGNTYQYSEHEKRDVKASNKLPPSRNFEPKQSAPECFSLCISNKIKNETKNDIGTNKFPTTLSLVVTFRIWHFKYCVTGFM